MRTMLVTLTGLVTAVTLVLASALAPAAGADPLRFWGYWQNKGDSWQFATTGPAQAKPKDGAVEGWRFAVSKGEQGTPPRAKADFDEICKTERARQGRKRVAVVVDYGERPDAPKGQTPPAPRTGCAVVAPGATGADALAAVTKAQSDTKGLVCAIDAYPAGACGQPAAPPASGGAAAKGEGKGGESGGFTGLAAGLLLVVVVAGAGTLLAVRRRRAGGPPQ